MLTDVGDQGIAVVLGAGMASADSGAVVAEMRRTLQAESAVVGPVRVRLARYDRPRLLRPFVGHADVDVAGGRVRAQVAVSRWRGLAPALGARLAEQVGAATRPPAPRSWPDERSWPEPVSPACGEFSIVRRKVVRLERCSAAEAALVMDRLDRGFHLFLEVETGAESVVRRVGPTGYRLTRLAGLAPPGPVDAAYAVPMTVDVHPVPICSVERIARRLVVAELDHRFFRDTATGCGAVLYRRYDGDFTLLCGEHGA